MPAPFGLSNNESRQPSQQGFERASDDLWGSALLTEKGQVTLARQFVFSPERWLRAKQENTSPAFTKALRCMVQIGTIQAVLSGRYLLPDLRVVTLDKKQLISSSKRAIFYSSDHPLCRAPTRTATIAKRSASRVIQVVRADCLAVAQRMLQLQPNSQPLVMVAGSRSHAGGGYRSGAGAQEESICRRSNLWQVLDDPYQQAGNDRAWTYPLAEFGGIYSRDVVVFRAPESEGYAFLPTPLHVSFFNLYAYQEPPTETNTATGEIRLEGKLINHYRNKLQAFLRIAAEHGNHSLVLGALGCGAYHNPPGHMAELFREALSVVDAEAKQFTTVIFAILEDHNSFLAHNPNGNAQPFADVFGCPLLSSVNELIV